MLAYGLYGFPNSNLKLQLNLIILNDREMKLQFRKIQKEEDTKKRFLFAGQSSPLLLSLSYEAGKDDKVIRFEPIGLNKKENETIFYGPIMTCSLSSNCLPPLVPLQYGLCYRDK